MAEMEYLRSVNSVLKNKSEVIKFIRSVKSKKDVLEYQVKIYYNLPPPSNAYQMECECLDFYEIMHIVEYSFFDNDSNFACNNEILNFKSQE